MPTASQERPQPDWPESRWPAGLQPDSTWDEHYSDERDAAFLYRQLAGVETNRERRDLFERLAHVEDRHVLRWEELFREGARPLPAYAPSWRTRMLARLARWFGSGMILPLLLAEEGREVQAYLRLARSSAHRSTHKAAVDIAASALAQGGKTVMEFEPRGLERAPNLWAFLFTELSAPFTRELIAGRRDDTHWTGTEFLDAIEGKPEPTGRQVVEVLSARDAMRCRATRT